MLSKTFCKQFIFVVFFSCITPSISFSAEVIASPHVKTNSLSLENLRHIFFMRVHQWPDGNPIKVYVLKDNNELHKQFCKQQLGVFPYKLRRLWDRHIFSGTGQAPTVLDNEEQMIKIISASENGIGYANKKIIEDLNKGSLNVQFINIE